MRVAYSSSDINKVVGHPGKARYIVILDIDQNGNILNKTVIDNIDKDHTEHYHHKNKLEILPSIKKADLNFLKEEDHSREDHHKWDHKLSGVDIFITKSCSESFMQRMKNLGIKIIITDKKTIEEALAEALPSLTLS